MKIASNITQTIGNTPLVHLASLSHEAMVIAKCEFMNPTGSIKDRIGIAMIHDAMAQGHLQPHQHIVEPTSGNTGIALASACAALGIKLTLVMPESMSLERRRLLAYLGAHLVLTEGARGMGGALERTREILDADPDAITLDQFANAANPHAHFTTTAQEILADTQGQIDLFVAAVGTGGTLMGVGRALRELLPQVRIVAVEPAGSPMLSHHRAGPHKIQGIGAGFIPQIVDTSLYDEVITITDDEAIAMSRRIAREEGILIGLSAGANIHAAMLLAQRSEYRGKRIVTIACDSAERYLSTLV